MLKKIVFLGLSLILLGAAHAGATIYEYSDAPGYQMVRHTSGTFQRLGQKWDAENQPLSIDSSDDGISWSIDNGTTWKNNDVKAGQNIRFKFDMTRADCGDHPYDELGAWIDWNGDKTWTKDEEVFYTRWDKGDTQTGDSIGNKDHKDPLFMSFITDITIPQAAVGQIWLRARVACSSSILDTDEKRITPYNSLYQGEVEDWAINVSPVPEPSSLVLIYSGLIVVAGVSRKKNQHKIL